MVKIYNMGKRINSPWQVFKAKVKYTFKVMVWIFILVGVVVGIFEAGRYINPPVIYTKQEVIKEVDSMSPVLARIASCESVGSAKLTATHFDKNGQVLMRSNTNRSVDLGKYQINSIWFAKATELGLDLTKEKDNEEMAKWIYKNRGTGDWSASYKCWQK